MVKLSFTPAKSEPRYFNASAFTSELFKIGVNPDGTPIVFDDDYEKLCPWASVMRAGNVWPDELTDAAVRIFESEKNNREQRRRKREARNNKD